MASSRYRVAVADGAAKEVRRLPKRTQKAVIAALEALAVKPRAGKPLGGDLTGLWSLRRGDYRILYRISDRILTVEVARIGHRREVYRRGP